MSIYDREPETPEDVRGQELAHESWIKHIRDERAHAERAARFRLSDEERTALNTFARETSYALEYAARNARTSAVLALSDDLHGDGPEKLERFRTQIATARAALEKTEAALGPLCERARAETQDHRDRKGKGMDS